MNARFSLVLVAPLVAACGKKPAPPPESRPLDEKPATATATAAAPNAPAPGAPGAEDAPPRIPRPTVTDTLPTSAGPVTVTPIRHASVAFGFGSKTIVIDPTSDAPPGWLPKADLVLITDVHRDHYDPPAVAEVRKERTLFVVPKAVSEDLPEAKVLNNGQKTELLGVRVEAVAAYNLKRGPEPGSVFHEKGRGNGYLLGFGDKTIYVSGDTECTPEMKALTNVDLAFVCMNLPYTMPPDEAAECVKAFKPKIVVPYHYRGREGTGDFKQLLSATPGVEVRLRNFYAGG